MSLLRHVLNEHFLFLFSNDQINGQMLVQRLTVATAITNAALFAKPRISASSMIVFLIRDTKICKSFSESEL
jgi:hypothetical protein